MYRDCNMYVYVFLSSIQLAGIQTFPPKPVVIQRPKNTVYPTIYLKLKKEKIDQYLSLEHLHEGK